MNSDRLFRVTRNRYQCERIHLIITSNNQRDLAEPDSDDTHRYSKYRARVSSHRLSCANGATYAKYLGNVNSITTLVPSSFWVPNKKVRIFSSSTVAKVPLY